MSPEARQRAKAIAGEAIQIPSDRRTAYVREACQGDARLLDCVLALLEADSPLTPRELQVHPALEGLLNPTDVRPAKETRLSSLGSVLSAPGQPDSIGALIKDRYRIEKTLGWGGFAATYLGADTQLDFRPVVVKILLEHHARDEWVLKKFHHEMQALARLDHPGVVGALDSGKLPDGRPFLVIQFVKGITLRQALHPTRGMGLERTGNIVRQVGYALSAAHQEGICHRDVKPENIMLYTLEGGEEQVKLIDFGIASIRDAQLASSGDSTKISGTLDYMAPEQFQGVSSPASDIYALGVVTYEMITGRPPFVAENPAQFIAMQLEGVKVKPKDLRPTLPAEAQAAILKALRRDPSERFVRARDFGEVLSKSLASNAVLNRATMSVPLEPRPKRAWITRGPWLWAASLTLTLLAGVWILSQQSRSTPKQAPIANSPLKKTENLPLPQSETAKNTATAENARTVPASAAAGPKTRTVKSKIGSRVATKIETLPKPQPIDLTPRAPKPETPKTDITAPYNEALRLFGQKNYAAAIERFSDVIQQEPKRADAWRMRGISYYWMSRYVPAIADLSEAIRLDPGNDNPLRFRMTAYLRQGEYEKAAADASEVIRLNPAAADAYSVRARLHSEKQDYSKAIEDLNIAIQRADVDRNRATYYSERGDAYFRLKQVDRSLADYDEAIRLETTVPSFFTKRAAVKEALGDREGADNDRRFARGDSKK